MKIRYLCLCPSRNICGAANTKSTYTIRDLKKCNKNIRSLKPTSTKRKLITFCIKLRQNIGMQKRQLTKSPRLCLLQQMLFRTGKRIQALYSLFHSHLFYPFTTQNCQLHKSMDHKKPTSENLQSLLLFLQQLF